MDGRFFSVLSWNFWVKIVRGRTLSKATSVQTIVTGRAQGYQILFSVITGMTAKSLVMDLEIGRTAAGLTSPSIPPQDFCTKPLVRFWIEPQAGMFCPD
jgi:hypothetical protein